MSGEAKKRRLKLSAYHSPYTRSGAPRDRLTKEDDPYAILRSQALATLEAMGFDQDTMIERGISWGGDQDPFGHVNQAKIMEFIGDCLYRVAELSYDWLSEEEYQAMARATGVNAVASVFKTTFKRQIKYPDAVIIAFRQDTVEHDRSSGSVVLFSLQQQKIVAESIVTAAWVDSKTGRPVDITKGPGNWPKVHAGLTQKCKDSQLLKEKWIASTRKPAGLDKPTPKAKI